MSLGGGGVYCTKCHSVKDVFVTMQSNFDTEFDVGSLGFVRTLRSSPNNSEAQRNIYMIYDVFLTKSKSKQKKKIGKRNIFFGQKQQ